MKLMKSFLAVSFAILVSACNKDKIRGSGDVISEVRNVTGFTGVVVNGSTKAFINIGTAFTVTVKGYKTLLPFLETNIKNSVLEVAFSNNVTVNNDNTEIYITRYIQHQLPPFREQQLRISHPGE